MEIRHKEFVVFLDVDGVLNTRTTVQHTPSGFTGIDDARVRILADAIKKYGVGDIVLTSDWKGLSETDDDYIYLVSKLEMQGLKIKSHAPDVNYDRGAGVAAYLEAHPEIKEYVILDDCPFDFEQYKRLWERLLLTNGIENIRFASRTPAVEALLFKDYIHLSE